MWLFSSKKTVSKIKCHLSEKLKFQICYSFRSLRPAVRVINNTDLASDSNILKTVKVKDTLTQI